MTKLPLIDDSPTVQKVMSMSLMANGFAVTVATTAAGGVDLARGFLPQHSTSPKVLVAKLREILGG